MSIEPPVATAPSPPRVLMVVPTLGRRPALLARALASIRSQGQVGVDLVIVCPDPTSDVRATAAAQGAALLVHPGHISAAVNLGWSQAAGQAYLGWVGDDDQVRPGALDRAVSLLERHPACSAAFGACDYVDADDRLMFARRPPWGAAWALQVVPGLIKQEACLFRATAVRAAGGLDEALRYAMDLDLLLRLQRHGPFARVEATQAAFCWHPGSLTIANRAASLAEAQQVQRTSARGWARVLLPVAQPLLRWALLGLSAQISRRAHHDA